MHEVKQTNNIHVYTIQYTKCALAYMILKKSSNGKGEGNQTNSAIKN